MTTYALVMMGLMVIQTLIMVWLLLGDRIKSFLGVSFNSYPTDTEEILTTW